VLAGKLTLVAEAPPELVANVAPDDVDDRLTVVAVVFVVGLPKVSSSVTVNDVVAEELAVALNPFEIKSWVPAPALIVSIWVSDVSPVAAAVMVGVPATVSP
jgi:hypothetical protein